ncbi:MAG: hypothetical protein H6739_40925 [Alphaproteobacteria bacterium]|nr:hypothetical protein [Alphaproteobacteria bacterium]
MRTRLLLVSLCLAACSEYEVLFQKDNPVGVDSGPRACDDPDLSPGVVPINDACSTAITDLEPVLEWADRSVHDVLTTPVVGQLTDDNGDGYVDDLDVPDIVAISVEGISTPMSLWVLSGDGSGVHWHTDELTFFNAQPAIGDVNGDGRPDVVTTWRDDTMRYSDGFAAYDGSTGALLWTSTAEPHIISTSQGLIGLYDLEGDGSVEVVIGDVILEGATGEVRAVGGRGMGSPKEYEYWAPMSIAADLDGDGIQEILAGNTAYGPGGEILWANDERDGAVAVGNFDDDPEGELVAVSWRGEVRLQDTDGRVIWKTVLGEWDLGPPAIADVDGDGRPEIGVAGSTTIYSLDADGGLMWTQEAASICAGSTGLSAFDFDGDGIVEWVHADDFDVLILDGLTGAVRSRIEEHSHKTATIYPTIADLDKDGSAEVIVAETIWTGPERGIQVFGHPRNGWMPTRSSWNQHGYGRTQADDAGHVLATPEAPWLSQNSFRAAEMSVAEHGSEPLPDAALQLVETCACDEGRVRVVVRVANKGLAELPAGLPVALGVGENGAWLALETLETEAPVAPGGTTPGLVFDLDAEVLYSDTLEVRVDGAALIECDPADNTLLVEVPSCG